MQYILCPRCQFKATVKTNVCNTCGFHIKEYLNKIASKKAPESENSVSALTKMFSKILPKANNSNPDEEKHALS